MRCRISVALVHAPVLNRQGKTAVTAVTPVDVYDFARSCAFYGVQPVYLVHPAPAMHRFVEELCAYWCKGGGARRNPARAQALASVRMVSCLQDVLGEVDAWWYTSARPPAHAPIVSVRDLAWREGRHLLVFGTGCGLDAAALPEPSGWLSPIEGDGMVRHLSVRAALSIYLDRLFAGRA
ncbi:MAG: hypothetical protein D6678_00980 [Zetaproteobacteria bacterium]|nr:MAG: hypothetical protein D6678_00980 [Zetaproteobacteria bacterium]